LLITVLSPFDWAKARFLLKLMSPALLLFLALLVEVVLPGELPCELANGI
jgi:hypothetical protein